MERPPITAVLLTCSTCGLVRMADDYGSAHARGNAHVRLSGHPKIQYSQIEAPDRIRGALQEAKASMETMAAQAGVSNISVEAGVEWDVAAGRCDARRRAAQQRKKSM